MKDYCFTCPPHRGTGILQAGMECPNSLRSDAVRDFKLLMSVGIARLWTFHELVQRFPELPHFLQGELFHSLKTGHYPGILSEVLKWMLLR